jgi:hypothetical protein
MESIIYKDIKDGMAARKLSSVHRKTPKIPCKSLIPGATTLRVLADGSKGCRTRNLLYPQ